MKSVKNSGISLNNDNRVLFKINYSFISSPSSYFQYITGVYLYKAIQNKQCKLLMTPENAVEWIECKKEFNIKQLKPLKFEFETVTIILEPINLFITLPFHNETMVFGIVLDRKNENYDWIFGDIAISQFHLIYSFVNQSIFFSNQRIIEENKINSSNRLLVFIIFALIVIIIPLCIALYVKYKTQRQKNSQINNEWNAFMKLEAFNL